MDEIRPATPPSGRQLLQNRSVALFLVASGVSSIAMFLQAAALGKLLFDITDSELALGLLGLVEFLPALLLLPLTGSAADRFDRRRVGAIALVAEGGVAIALCAYAASDPTASWPLFALAAVFGVARAFAAPSMRSLPPLLAPGGALPRLMAFYTATWMLGLIVGPASSGFLYDVDITLPYVVSASGFIIAAAVIMAVRVLHHQERTPSDQRATLHHTLEGLRFVRHQRVLLGAIGLDMFAVLFGGAVALLPAIAEDRLGVGNVGYGWLRAAPGIGGATLTALMAIRPVGRHIGRTLFIVVGIFGAATVVFGWTHNYAVAFVALVVLSGADAVSVYIRATLVPLATPDHMRGRVMAVENVFIGASNELGAFESGVAAQLIGVGPAVMLGGLMTLAVVGVFSIRFVELRRIDTFGEIYTAREVETIRARPG